ncbi:branched-chain amino acid ABC transporter permease [Neopusillimonas maritima]|jgi:branched-chain amino acid transport system permease protein|uniref:Branched-chain amino acid ABC transporter permease n=1 Tax=Neopusillimonas maritima TaxID=2026239 RepID=A0A3A1Z195_9BURK|nr:branched-chain amino acid ABC transporter permease [Neopusillimonas maritima]MAL00580.1 branched-chain amino acid ABC transporter permease [Alcaligenaceae bacterium]RII82537.1 branched-chain amino acid ABC transporter permease [Neopusillimonas maritima]RIY42514.1 branched-chain amino acid ABC transporter permease [Neopusillimonas maritima]
MSDVQSTLLRNTRFRIWEPFFWVVPFVILALFPGQSFLINQMAIMALYAISLDLILGYTGIMSLGHAAFFGLGAYAAGLFCIHVSPDPIIGLVAGMVVAGIGGLIFSVTVLRGTHLTVVMVTLGVSLILYELANYLTGLTGGADGLQGVDMAPIFGIFQFKFDGITAAYYSLVVLLVFLFICRRLAHSPFGFSLKAIRDNRLRATAIGISAERRIILIYTIAGAIAGVAGAVQAQSMNFASLEVFSFEKSADVLLMVVIGGTAWVYGGFVGAIVFSGLHHILSDITPQYWTFWVGLFLVVLMRVGRDRLLRPWTWFRRETHG